MRLEVGGVLGQAALGQAVLVLVAQAQVQVQVQVLLVDLVKEGVPEWLGVTR